MFNNKGFTLIEFLIACFLSILLIGMFISTMSASFNVISKGDTRTEAQQNARVAIDEFTSLIHQAEYFTKLSKQEIEFILSPTYIENGRAYKRKVKFKISQNNNKNIFSKCVARKFGEDTDFGKCTSQPIAIFELLKSGEVAIQFSFDFAGSRFNLEPTKPVFNIGIVIKAGMYKPVGSVAVFETSAAQRVR